jgi:hypothetical protein
LRHVCRVVVALVLAFTGPQLHAQQAARSGDVYHVHFTKAVPGQGTALGDFLRTPDPKSPMPGHFIVLRHQQGDDWDYCVIEHLGAKATVDPAGTPPNPGTDLRAWHADTFTSGPTWAEFAKSMGISDAAGATGSVYSVAVWRALPGHRDQLLKSLQEADRGSKVQVGRVTLQHLEGGPWQFLQIERYNSWQDLATEMAATSGGAPGSQDGWSAVREHSTYHHDTLADRLPAK